METAVLNCFMRAAQDLANKWSSTLTYEEILSEVGLLYSTKPQKWLSVYEESPERFQAYSYTVLKNYLIRSALMKEERWQRYNYLCDDGMMDAIISGEKKLTTVYQPNPTELRRDVKRVLNGTASETMKLAWTNLTSTQRNHLTEFAQLDNPLTEQQRKASKFFILRVV